MSWRRKQTRGGLLGGLPTGATYEGREVIQDAAGFEYPAPRAGEDRARSRQTAPLDRQAMLMNPQNHESRTLCGCVVLLADACHGEKPLMARSRSRGHSEATQSGYALAIKYVTS